ncbi:MAG: hypothetical protein HRU15_16465 [Planctomycetes bacterium]|nr:hypothetical protein [Planctomycetota bacterium]
MRYHTIVFILLLSVFAPLVAQAQEKVPATPWGITPDQRAIDSGIYIQPRPLATRSTVSFTVSEPSGIARANYPVRGSIPFFRGEFKDIRRLQLTDANGAVIPVQALVTAFWPEGTAKFLCLDFLTTLKASEIKSFTLSYGSELAEQKVGAIAISDANGVIQVNTGILKTSFQAGDKWSAPVQINDLAVTREGIQGFLSVSEGSPEAKPTDYNLTVESVVLEEHGPVQATVYIKGFYSSKKAVSPMEYQKKHPRYPFHSFVRVYANSARMDVTYSFGYNGNEHEDFVRRYGLKVPLAAKGAEFSFGVDGGKVHREKLSKAVLLAQPHHSNWELSGASTPQSGKRIDGWAAMNANAENISLVMSLRNAWQQWPVSYRADANGDFIIDIHGGTKDNFLDLRYHSEPDGPNWVKPDPKKKYDKVAKVHDSKSMYNGKKLSTHYLGEPFAKAAGILKISELVLDFTPNMNHKEIGEAHHQMLVPWPDAKRYAETRVFNMTGYFDDLNNPIQQEMVNFHARINVDLALVQHEAQGLYGWVDYPDALDLRPPKGKENHFDDRTFLGGEGWNNGEKVNQAVVSLYVSSGWRRALDYGHQMLLHTIGIDAEHPGGDQATSVTHRHCQVHWGTGGSPRQSGAYIGWHWYYWISGHNEIGRSLHEMWPDTLGINRASFSKAKWPTHDSTNIETEFVYDPELKQAYAFSAKGSIYHWVNFNRWQTTGDTKFVRYFESLYHGLSKNPYKVDKKKNKKVYDENQMVSLVDDVSLIKQGDLANLGDPIHPPKPHFYDYYFRSYYGKSLVAEWAALTGSKHAINVLLLMGDHDWSAAEFNQGYDDTRAESTYRKNIKWLYKSHGQYMQAYYLLRKDNKDFKQHLENMLELVHARTARLRNTMDEVPDPANYSAQEWIKNFKSQPWNTKPYSKNGIKNNGGHMNAVLGNLWFYNQGLLDINKPTKNDKNLP